MSTHHPEDDRRRVGRTLFAICVGHALEWYDWGIYTIFVPFFAGQFFPEAAPGSALLSGLAVFAVGFVARPLGGLLVGRLADRVGRRPMMSLTVGGMAGASLLIGVAPTYAAAGVGASLILLLCRVVQGLATGGELPSAQTYLTEQAPARRRGLWSSLIYIASVGGNSLGVLLGLVLSLTLSHEDMLAYGWRIPFVVGGLLGLVALWVRRSLEESAVFVKERERPAAKQPFWPELVRHRRAALQVIGMTVGPTVVYYAWVIAAPAYAMTNRHLASTPALLAGVLSSLVLIAVLPAWGALSDRVGRRPVLLISHLGTAVTLFPLQLLDLGDAVQLGLAMSLAMVFIGAGVSILPAAYAEMFPTHIRTAGLAVPYSVAVAAFGGTAPYLQTWTGQTLGPTFFTGYVVLLLLVSAATVLTLKEGRGSDLNTLDQAVPEKNRKAEQHDTARHAG
ncbi:MULTISPECIES: MFS transporter [Streptomyces]|jgi:MHS family alpha-ketoglutarate permease-like MFS transporter|uniref:Transmembrane transport protein n=3 Tax=Streptomyces griseoaurantiacus TaxID=68213 RepID=F3NNQ8_9ACTN|nr:MULTISPECIES: MFS transporter [Streptomyces]EGG44720.1 transmembrane transport protein [Streptomyces griseoaurantiacus M045]MBA5220908.1 MFS transporter [Streptomyces griseoaurantiacus]MCF0090400.1 Proline/betaine transporter [Streptomyces sp. MH192]MCF0102681.1 Proline/betaine transporter [Streptomyces sp. MH191]MDX3086793.1 MFS transporter [Streptomyces sp. ME12-02E]